ncbi:bifunctional protein-disulfide isomerase/oxidoreductase DsbC [Shewanella rhizosphaerae]|uniref:bifunctional protein-disulfide isomerase/oxidoreductase DsbC n=1 Tax=Shewanella TaxID=22 RepID=UPI001C65A751|nr:MULTISPECIES: bifunctional protein-disulfide isomerase/oxidoreductase DsbC [Shewanella]QYJ83181.1 bifunctional protein-disulfide isomerase/oxidoreductase DsbC [Shewanella aegiceratis]QYK13686.1 bifunctional protein-disulfide isomerase/oxidoreductase DsbC [Shewanella rhizosphaerae]
MKFTRALTLVVAMVATPLMAASNNVVDNGDQLKQKLSDTLGVEVQNLSQSPIPGLYEAITNRGVLYISKDGTKLFHGNLYDLDNGMKNLTEAALAGPRMEAIKPFEPNMLVYKAKDEKHVVTVFTDITCGYCRKLHNQIDKYNDLGITVRYLAFPRQGVPSKNASDMEAVWCSADPLKALTDAKAGKQIGGAKCDAKIAQQYNLGQSLGVNGTPAIILEDGTMIPGYQPPEQLIQVLDRIQ